MNRIIEKSKVYKKGAYSVGLLRSVDIMILWIEKEISKSKQRTPEPNSPSQIFNDGVLKGYNKMLSVLKARKNNISERIKLNKDDNRSIT